MQRREEIERLKRIDLVSYLESMGFRSDWRRGDRAMFVSPLRAEKNPSFYVQRNENGFWSWKDWGTGESGDIIKFVMLYYGIDFKEAIERIGGLPSSPYSTPKKSVVEPRRDSVDWVREFHRKESLMGSKKMEMVRSYFLKMGVRYHSEMKCILVKDRREGKLYIGIPVPFPLKMRGLELREINGDSRKTWGRKTLWLLKRDPGRFLITESILDALSGEIILADQTITLCSLNGVSNVAQLDVLFSQYNPEQVVLALDADEAGRKATQEALEIAHKRSVRVTEFTAHLALGVKDLHKMLMHIEKRRFENYGRHDLSEVWRAPVLLS